MRKGKGKGKNKLCSNNAWSKTNCEREDCIICTSGEKQWGDCRKEGVVYTIKCLKCKGEGVLAEYWGETAQTTFERGEEHLDCMRRRDSGSTPRYTIEES